MDSLQPHIRCSRQDGAAYAILPGDPARVERIKGFLEDVKEIAFNREHRRKKYDTDWKLRRFAEGYTYGRPASDSWGCPG